MAEKNFNNDINNALGINKTEVNNADGIIANIVRTKEQVTPLKKKEIKNKQINFLTKPSTAKALKVIAKKYKISVNDLLNQLAEERIEKEGK